MLDEIVLIDDDSLNHKICACIIRQFLPDTPIHFFSNGEAGLSYLIGKQDEQLKTLVLLDLQMPVMTGFEFLNIYENAIAHQHPPFTICLLSSEVEATKRRCLKAYPSVLDYANKPLEVSRIEELIARAIEKLNAQPTVQANR
jgi:CheY-like chemotaxis protein